MYDDHCPFCFLFIFIKFDKLLVTKLVVILQQCKKTEIRQKIEQVRNGVTDFTNSIEGMRITRDSKNSAIDKLQKEIRVSNRPLASIKISN